MDVEALRRTASRLGEAALDPTLWPDLLQQIAIDAEAFGAVLLQAGVPTVDVPWSPSLGRMREVYYGEGWNARDLRAVRSVAAVRRNLTVLTDEDLVSRDEVKRDPYYTSFLASQGLPAFAAVVFQSAPSTSCGLVISRTASQGEFDSREKQILALLGPRLTATAELGRMLGEASIRTSLAVLDRLFRPTLALGQSGVVLDANSAAGALFDDDMKIRAGSLHLRDERAMAEILGACAQAQAPFGLPTRTPGPIVVRREGRLPLVVRPLPLDGPAGSFLSGARLLVTITDPGAGDRPHAGLLGRVFGMTGAEARLADRLMGGLSLQQAADLGGVTVETTRGQLKAVFSKTGTRRQAELVALLSRL